MKVCWSVLSGNHFETDKASCAVKLCGRTGKVPGMLQSDFILQVNQWMKRYSLVLCVFLFESFF